MSHTKRIIVLIDMDCFYCQVEENLNPSYKGKPLAVVQYNQWRGGGIIAVNYPARDKGVTRHMRGNDAKKKCSEIILVKVPEVRGKADLSKYRDAGKRVADVLQTFTPYLERASVDEAYLDITHVVEKRIQEKNDEISMVKLQNTFVVGNLTADFVENVNEHRSYDETNFKLALGGVIAEEIREEVYKVTGYRCSAGVAHNKILAKLVCGLHKPNKQTLLPHEAVPQLYEKMPIKKIKSLGGKFGDKVLEILNIEYMSELAKFDQRELAQKLDEKSASWLYNIARGIDTEPVNTRLISKSIGCCKKFPGRSALCRKEEIEHWLNELADEMFERLEKDLEENNRKARQMVVSFAQDVNDDEIHSSKSHPLNSYEQQWIFENAFKIVQKNCLKDDGTYRVTFLGISVCNFQDVKKVKEITSFFKNMRQNGTKGRSFYTIDSETRIKDNDSEASEKRMYETINHEGRRSRDQNIHDTNDDSVYSCSTQDSDNGAYKNLVYYEHVHPESVVNQDYFTSNVEAGEMETDCDISNDSISNEIARGSEGDNIFATPGNSFFSKYFSSNMNRNFDTSKKLENDDPADNVEVINDNIQNTGGRERRVDATVLETNDASSEITDVIEESNEEIVHIRDDVICPECGKIIDKMDYQPHLDYHFAISIVKNEAHLYKNVDKSPPQAQRSSTPINNSCRKKKRKEVPSASFKPIGDYFKTDPINKTEDAKGTCAECSRQIVLSEWEVHMDYHAAKKLHLEMNVNVIHGGPPKQKQAKTKFKGQKNIMGFLKSS